MDFYLDRVNVQDRLLSEYYRHDSLVIAFDFDDTVYDFHKKGRLYSDVIQLLKENDIPFDTINENPPFRNSSSRKIYANAFLDDRAGLLQSYEDLTILIKQLKNE